MNPHQPSTTPSYGYDRAYPSLQGTSMAFFGYDASANRFTAFNFESSPGTAARFRQFTGKERDAESGLDFFEARYYGSALGRFTSPDEPMADQEVQDPQSWNLYAYVRNNPLKNTDPSGMDCITTSNQSGSSVTVATERGGSAASCSGTFVDGTVDTNSLTYNGSSIGYSFANGNASGAGTIAFSSNQDASDISPFGLSVVQSVGRNTNSMYGLMGAFVGGSASIGVAGGAACYYLCDPLADLFGSTLSNADAGNVIGWGKGQAGAEATRDLAKGLTRGAVNAMKRNGLTKNTVQQLLEKYESAATKAAQSGITNTQLPERIELMKTILRLW